MALRGESPRSGRRFRRWLQSARARSAHGGKTKDVIAAGVSAAIRCDDRTAFQVNAVSERGARRDEMLETLRIALYMVTGAAVIYASPALCPCALFAGARAPQT